jgi:hypothetical protein
MRIPLTAGFCLAETVAPRRQRQAARCDGPAIQARTNAFSCEQADVSAKPNIAVNLLLTKKVFNHASSEGPQPSGLLASLNCPKAVTWR